MIIKPFSSLYYKQLLTYMENCGVKAMIAGGAVRDKLLGKPIADVDIFYEGELNVEKLKQYLPNLQPADPSEAYEVDCFQITHKLPASQGGLVLVGSNLEHQFIKVFGPLEKHLDTFCADISKVAYAKNGIFMHKAFLNALTSEMITYKNAPQHYIDKIHNKYPEFLTLSY